MFAGFPEASLDLFASRRTLQFVARVRSWQFHISTATGIYLWPTNRHHLPRWGLVRRSA